MKLYKIKSDDLITVAIEKEKSNHVISSIMHENNNDTYSYPESKVGAKAFIVDVPILDQIQRITSSIYTELSGVNHSYYHSDRLDLAEPNCWAY